MSVPARTSRWFSLLAPPPILSFLPSMFTYHSTAPFLEESGTSRLDTSVRSAKLLTVRLNHTPSCMLKPRPVVSFHAAMLSGVRW